MKTPILFSLLIATTVFVSSCDPANGIDPTTSQIVASGNWRVTLFTDSGNDETSDFSGYTFTFNSSGILTVVKNGLTTNGTWNASNSSNKFNIDLGPKIVSNKPLGELTNDWKIISKTETLIKLTDDNATSNEFLTFTKN